MKSLIESLLDAGVADKTLDKNIKNFEEVMYIRELVHKYLYEPTIGFSYDVTPKTGGSHWFNEEYGEYTIKMKVSELNRLYRLMGRELLQHFGQDKMLVELDSERGVRYVLEFRFKMFEKCDRNGCLPYPNIKVIIAKNSMGKMFTYVKLPKFFIQ